MLPTYGTALTACSFYSTVGEGRLMFAGLFALVAFAALNQTVPSLPPPPGSHQLPPLHVGSTTIVCPVGGEHFPAVTTNMWSVTGRRPDEKPYSEVSFPRPLPECPGNGLVVFASFTSVETAELASWISTPIYQTMRKTESPFYRAYWLAVKIHRPEADAIELLLPAIWEAKDADGKDTLRPRTTRYQRVLVDAVQKDSPSISLDDRIWLRGQAANALREMGRFDAAEMMRGIAEADVPRSARPALGEYLQKLRTVIARHDRSDEPLDMIPNVQAALICEHRPRPNAFEQGYCEQPAIASIFQRVDPGAPTEVARRAASWALIDSAARACHLKVLDKKIERENAVALGLTYQLEPDTAESQKCFYAHSNDNGAGKP